MNTDHFGMSDPSRLCIHGLCCILHLLLADLCMLMLHFDRNGIWDTDNQMEQNKKLALSTYHHKNKSQVHPISAHIFLRDEMCLRDLECWASKGLICESKKCVCPTSYVWSTTETKCLLAYGQKGCQNDLMCNVDQNLKCVDEDCNCPFESQGLMCDCERNSNVEEYWDGKQCTRAKDFNYPCSNEYECHYLTQNTHCINSSCVCKDFDT